LIGDTFKIGKIFPTAVMKQLTSFVTQKHDTCKIVK